MNEYEKYMKITYLRLNGMKKYLIKSVNTF